jgi:hypothetical protein
MILIQSLLRMMSLYVQIAIQWIILIRLIVLVLAPMILHPRILIQEAKLLWYVWKYEKRENHRLHLQAKLARN